MGKGLPSRRACISQQSVLVFGDGGGRLPAPPPDPLLAKMILQPAERTHSGSMGVLRKDRKCGSMRVSLGFPIGVLMKGVLLFGIVTGSTSH